jgi:hypothetical protein
MPAAVRTKAIAQTQEAFISPTSSQLLEPVPRLPRGDALLAFQRFRDPLSVVGALALHLKPALFHVRSTRFAMHPPPIFDRVSQ